MLCSARGGVEGQREDECLPLVCCREIFQEHELPGSYFDYYITTNPLFSFQNIVDFCTHYQENLNTYF